MFSIVMMNWKRPDNTCKIVHLYKDLEQVGQIYVMDNSGSLSLSDFSEGSQSKLTLITSSSDLSLFSRFSVGALVKTNAVLYCDDDIIVPTRVLAELYNYWRSAPDVVHGLFGRALPPNMNYNTTNVVGVCTVVLTRMAVTSRFISAAALTNCIRMEQDGLAGDPRGNGEDIVLSYTAMALSNRGNRAYKLPFTNHGYDDVNAISVRVKDHLAFRDRVVKWSRKNILKMS